MTGTAAGPGLLPILFGDIAGKELERPMAYVILGGLTPSPFGSSALPGSRRLC